MSSWFWFSYPNLLDIPAIVPHCFLQHRSLSNQNSKQSELWCHLESPRRYPMFPTHLKWKQRLDMQGNGCLNYPLLQSGSCLCKSAWHPPRWEDHAEDLQQVCDTSAATYSSHSEFSPHIYQIRLGLHIASRIPHLQDRNWTKYFSERQHGLIMQTGDSTKGAWNWAQHHDEHLAGPWSQNRLLW